MAMNLGRRQKFVSDKKSNPVKTTKRTSINFDLTTLTLFSSFVMSSNANIKNSDIMHLRNLMEILDIGTYQNEPEKVKIIEFIKKAIEARLVYGIKNPALILKFTKGGVVNDNTEDNVIDLSNFGVLSNKEINYVNETISGALKFSFIENDVDKGLDLLTRIKASDYRMRDEIVSEFQEWIVSMNSMFRQVKARNVEDQVFTLKNDNKQFEEFMSDAYETLTAPTRKLPCGMQGLNEMIAGGFENGRVYGFLGGTGIGKSLLLLNIAIQIKKCNKWLKPKDPTKIPTIVILTMENTVIETVSRMFNIVASSNEMKNYTKEEVIQMLKEDGELVLTDDSPINIIIKYKANKSVNTDYLYELVEDLEDDGYETILLIQDHLKRINSRIRGLDLRIELGEVVNEMKVFAQLKDIPVLTNTHLNRDAAKVIDEMKRNNKADLTRMLGRANTGESMLILDNIDCAFIINVEYDIEGNKYMVFSRIKMRDRASKRDYICQPFCQGNDIKLVEDYYEAVPAFKETLKPQPNQLLNNAHLNTGTKFKNNINEVDEIIDSINKFDTDENIFSGSMYKEIPAPLQIDEIDEEPIEEMGQTMPLIIDENGYVTPIIFGEKVGA